LKEFLTCLTITSVFQFSLFMEFFYTFQHNGISYDVVWQDDIPTLSPISNYDEFNSIVEKNVDELSDM